MRSTHRVAPLAGRWLRRLQNDLDTVPRPEDAGRQFVAGPCPDRVLVLGNGAATGFGVRSQDLALPGHLARHLAVLTGRGAVVDVTSKRGLTVDQVPALAAGARPGRYDAIVLAVGATDAASFLPAARWRRGLTALLDDLQAQMPATTAVLVLATRPLQRSGQTRGLANVLMDAHAARLDAVTADVVGRHAGTRLLEPCASEGIDGPRSSPQYEALASRVADALAPSLDRLARTPDLSSARAQRWTADPEVLRQLAVDRSGLVGAGSTPQLERLLQSARDLHGTSAAAVALIDGDRVIYKSSLGLPPGAVDRALAPCNRTIRQAGALVVHELAGDPIAAHGWRFYAGHPIESPDGYRIGTLCVLDHAPRAEGDLDELALARLAARVETELWAEIEARRAAGASAARPIRSVLARVPARGNRPSRS